MKNLKQFILALLLCCTSGMVWAYDFEVDGIYYEATYPYTTVAVISKDYNYNSYSGDIVIPSTVQYNGRTYPVKYINSYAFKNCDNLTSLTIPNSITSIGEYAFDSCTSQISIVLPNSMTEIKNGAFYRFYGLTSITIPNSITKIGSSAFFNCTGLTSITIPNSVTSIEDATFKDCIGLTSVTIPNTVTSIGGSAFYGCTNLVSIPIPDSLNFIVKNTFEGTGWYNNQSDGIIYWGSWCLGYKGAEPTGSLSISDGTTGIASNAFSHCANLTSVSIPNSVTIICGAAFSYCTSLANFSLGNSVTSIGSEAFVNTNIQSLVFPPTTTSLGFMVLGYYSNYGEPYRSGTAVFLGITPPSMSQYLGNCDSGSCYYCLGASKIIVPCGTSSEYYEATTISLPNGDPIHFYSPIENCTSYSVTNEILNAGGSISLSETDAQMGDEVLIHITVEDGYAIKNITVYNPDDPTQTVSVYSKNTSKSAYTYAFIMPNFEVKVAVDIQKSGLGIGEDNILTTLHPNPTSGIVTIEAEDLQRVSVFNLIGQKVLENTSSGNSFKCDLSRYGAGIYMMQIETAKGLATRRVVVE